jgi:hypothetical protein
MRRFWKFLWLSCAIIILAPIVFALAVVAFAACFPLSPFLLAWSLSKERRP